MKPCAVVDMSLRPTQSFVRMRIAAVLFCAYTLAGCVVAPAYVLDEFEQGDPATSEYERRSENEAREAQR